MPNIKPISELRNYTTVVKEVSYGNRVYLTKNGYGSIAMVDMKELDEMDKQLALYKFVVSMREAEQSVHKEGTILLKDLMQELEVDTIEES